MSDKCYYWGVSARPNALQVAEAAKLTERLHTAEAACARAEAEVRACAELPVLCKELCADCGTKGSVT